MRWILSLSLLLFSCAIFGQDVLSPEELQEDFSQFKDALEKKNKGLYLFISEEEYAKHLDSIAQELNQEMSVLDFNKLLKKAIVPIQERHLSLVGFHKSSNQAKKIKGFEQDTVKLFPLYLLFQNDTTAYIIRDARNDSTIVLPSKIISINDQSIGDIRDEIASHMTYDYGVRERLNWEISKTFALQYYYNVDTTSRFLVELVNDEGTLEKEMLFGMPRKEWLDSLKNQSKQIYEVEKMRHPFRYTIYDSLGIGYLKISTFSQNKITYEKEKIRFKSYIKDFFRKVEEEQIDAIIIDVRDNGGGSVSNVKYLLSYIQPNDEKELMYFQTKNRDFWFGEVERERKSKKQREPHFDGDVYILTNPGSYSAAVMFPVMAKQWLNATIVGEPAGGRPNGTTAGTFHSERLKHSDIIVRIPRWIFTYPVEEDFSIEPDIYIEEKIEDYFDFDSDHILDTLLQMIQDGR